MHAPKRVDEFYRRHPMAIRRTDARGAPQIKQVQLVNEPTFNNPHELSEMSGTLRSPHPSSTNSMPPLSPLSLVNTVPRLLPINMVVNLTLSPSSPPLYTHHRGPTNLPVYSLATRTPPAGFQVVTTELLICFPELILTTNQRPDPHMPRYVWVVHTTVPHLLAVDEPGETPTRLDLYAQPRPGCPDGWPRDFEEALCPADSRRDPLLPQLLTLKSLGIKADFDRYRLQRQEEQYCRKRIEEYRRRVLAHQSEAEVA
ncbi:hypothetical protein EDB83DRAFT_2531758 [Lactarius deliciosus]|nr:hypothetical protein EDB83DRAFT_2531758 [Lactarius deliciosus]